MIYLTNELPALIEKIKKMKIELDEFGRYRILRTDLASLLPFYSKAIHSKNSIIALNLMKKIAENSVEIAEIKLLDKLKNAKKIIITDLINDASEVSVKLISMENEAEKIGVFALNRSDLLKEIKENALNIQVILLDELNNKISLCGSNSANKEELIENLIAELNEDFCVQDEINIFEKKLYEQAKINPVKITDFKLACNKEIINKNYSKISLFYEKELKENHISKFNYFNTKNILMNTLQQDINELLVELQHELTTVTEEHAEALTMAINALLTAGAEINRLFSLPKVTSETWGKTHIIRADHFKFPIFQKAAVYSFVDKVSQQNTYFELLPNEVIRMIFRYIPIEYINYFNVFTTNAENKTAFHALKSIFNREHHQINYIEKYGNDKIFCNRFFKLITDDTMTSSELLDKIDFLPESEINNYIISDIHHYWQGVGQTLKDHDQYSSKDWLILTNKLIEMYQDDLRQLSMQRDQLLVLNQDIEKLKQDEPEEIEKNIGRSQTIYANKIRHEEIVDKIAKRGKYPLIKTLIYNYYTHAKMKNNRENNFFTRPMDLLYDFALNVYKSTGDIELLKYLLQYELSELGLFQRRILTFILNQEDTSIIELFIQTHLQRFKKEEIQLGYAAEIFFYAISMEKYKDIVKIILSYISQIELIKQLVRDSEKYGFPDSNPRNRYFMQFTYSLYDVLRSCIVNFELELNKKEYALYIEELLSITINLKRETQRKIAINILIEKLPDQIAFFAKICSDTKQNILSEYMLSYFRENPSTYMMLDIFLLILKGKNKKLLEKFQDVWTVSVKSCLQKCMVNAMKTSDIALVNLLLQSGIVIDFVKFFKNTDDDARVKINEICKKNVPSTLELKGLLFDVIKIEERVNDSAAYNNVHDANWTKKEFARLFNLVNEHFFMCLAKNDPVLKVYLTTLILARIKQMLPQNSTQYQSIKNLIDAICFDIYPEEIGDRIRVCIQHYQPMNTLKPHRNSLSELPSRLFGAKPAKKIYLVEILKILAEELFPVLENNNNNNNNNIVWHK